ncbi:hypothetical protein SLE2022_406070 [Rubroshorea leprosula]|uniref:Uncharacterized protein n=1 Tax=Rubroshorea leprosula TaxID=152421 RepID=A0AAV5MV91_9ROSI|nr:hypothetical protein SLEP1_g59578 [Rubroshorea leprosula]
MKSVTVDGRETEQPTIEPIDRTVEAKGSWFQANSDKASKKSAGERVGLPLDDVFLPFIEDGCWGLPGRGFSSNHTGGLKGLAILILLLFSTLGLTLFALVLQLSSSCIKDNFLISGTEDVN